MAAAVMGAIAASEAMAKVVDDAQEKTKQKSYQDPIHAALSDPSRLCIKESRLDKDLVMYDKRHVGKVRDSEFV